MNEQKHIAPQRNNRIAVIFGTRPEAIKLAPVILALREQSGFDCTVCVTGQHREMLSQVLDVFEITPDRDLGLMQPNQTLAGFTAKAILALDQYFADEKPDLILVQGDTTTVFCATLAAFYHHIRVGHVEAGLRTGNMHSPWPEEANRVLTSRLAALHFAPTESSRRHLLDEGIDDSRIYVTGNTVIDALFLALAKIADEPPDIPGLPDPTLEAWGNRQVVLITGHRRESFGEGFENICRAIGRLAQKHPDCEFVYPVHLNPRVRDPVARLLRINQAANIHLIEPLSYLPFVRMMARATLILTDSGGVQEEAPSLGKPVLVMRDTTERPEAVEMGVVKMVGTDADGIFADTAALLNDADLRASMANAVNPYGDGRAVQRILSALSDHRGV